jgi:hypothetical protein
MVRGLAPLAQHLGQHQRERLTDREQTLAICARQHFDQMVLDGGQGEPCADGRRITSAMLGCAAFRAADAERSQCDQPIAA